MYSFAKDSPLDIEELRARLRRMSDEALKQFGAAARYMCSPQASTGQPPRQAFVLEEAIAEWPRRHPKAPVA